jgi:hypothetical protein
MATPNDFDRSSIKYSIDVGQVAKREKHNGYENVIDELRYHIILECVIDGQMKSKKIFQVTHLDVDNIKDFVHFDSCNRTVLAKWASDHIEQTNIEALKDQALEEWFPTRVYVNV